MSTAPLPDRPQVTLAPSTLGGLLVNRGGRTIGWIHDAGGGLWNAYRPGIGAGDLLGTLPQDEAVRAIDEATRS